jgi:hypothetical protein
MLKKIAAAAIVAGLGFAVVPAAHAENACLHFDITVNDTTQVIDQCV